MSSPGPEGLALAIVGAFAAGDYECLAELSRTPLATQERLKVTSLVVHHVTRIADYWGINRHGFRLNRRQRLCFYALSRILSPQIVLFGISTRPVISDRTLVSRLLADTDPLTIIIVGRASKRAREAGQADIADLLDLWRSGINNP